MLTYRPTKGVTEVARKVIDEPSEDVVANAKRDRDSKREREAESERSDARATKQA